MNYIELIRQFWKCNNEIPIGCNATALYFYLLKVCNSLGWKETFKHSDRHISLQLGISINTVRLAKNKLKQLGLIDFKSPEKASRGLEGSTRYTIRTISNCDSVTSSVTDRVIDSVTDRVTDTRIKLNQTKLKEGSSVKATRFLPPTLEQVLTYCQERNNQVDAERFVDFYQSKNWMVGSNKMKDWQAAVRTWEKDDKAKGGKNGTTSQANNRKPNIANIAMAGIQED